MSLWNLLTSSLITGSHPEIYQNLRIINNLFDWKITLDNVADFSIQVQRIWLYDIVTGDKSCT
jgi:hypothetical protein